MQLSITMKENKGVAILVLNGRLVSGEECESFRRKIKELLANGQTRITQDLGEVTRVDSTGIGALVEAVILTAKAGGTLKLFNVPRLIRNILSTHRLLQAFEIYEKEETAIASFETQTQRAAS